MTRHKLEVIVASVTAPLLPAFGACLALVTLALAAPDQPKNARDIPGDPSLKPAAVLEITGHYYVAGTEAGVEYESLVTIRQRKDAYLLRGNTGGMVGVGLRNGNTLSVGISNNDGGIAVARYSIERDAAGKPRLVGKWTTPEGELHTETMEFLRPLK